MKQTETEMMVDFSRSFVRWTRPATQRELSAGPEKPRGNSARIQIDALCTLWNGDDSDRTTVYLSVPGRKEWMYEESGLFVTPTTEYRMIFSANRQVDVSMHGHRDDEHEPPLSTDGFASLNFEIETMRSEELPTAHDVVVAARDTQPLVARIAMASEVTGISAELEFPVRTLNYQEERGRFQIDTGPMIVPDLDRHDVSWPVERCRLAHVIFNSLTDAEFAIRSTAPESHESGSGEVLHNYSTIERKNVNTRLFQIMGD